MSLREKAGLTQFQVAVAMGKTPGAISKWDRTGAAEFQPKDVSTALELYQCSGIDFAEAFSKSSVRLTVHQFFRLVDLSGVGLTEFVEYLEQDKGT